MFILTELLTNKGLYDVLTLHVVGWSPAASESLCDSKSGSSECTDVLMKDLKWRHVPLAVFTRQTYPLHIQALRLAYWWQRGEDSTCH